MNPPFKKKTIRHPKKSKSRDAPQEEQRGKSGKASPFGAAETILMKKKLHYIKLRTPLHYNAL